MWLLMSRADPDNVFTLVGGKTYVVGRQNCDIVIADASVSRSQAHLSLEHLECNVMKSFVLPTLTLLDVSKFGTYVNGKSLKNSLTRKVELQEGDEIKFGGSPVSVFTVKYTPFLMTTSCIEKAPKKGLVKAMCLLGGHIVRDWRPNCEMLIMSKINVTIKVVCALNSQRHIVTPSYLEDLYSFYIGKKDKPDPLNYLPEVVDQEVPAGVSFHPDIKRTTLLCGLKVYFLSALQFNKTNLAVSTAGGQPILLEDGTEEDAEVMTQEGTLVISVSRDILNTLSANCQKFVKLVYSTLAAHNLRSISDPEVGWAILTCNIEKFCNPTSEITPNMYADLASQLSASQIFQEDQSTSKRPLHLKESDNMYPLERRPSEPTHSDNLTDLSRRTLEAEVKGSRSADVVSNTEHDRELSDTFSRGKDGKQKGQTSPKKQEVRNSGPGKINETTRQGPVFAGSDENDNVVESESVSKSGASRLSGDLFANSSFQETDKSSANVSTSSAAKLFASACDVDEEESQVSVFAKKRKTGRKIRTRDFDSDDSEEERASRKKAKHCSKGKGLFSFEDDDDSNGNPTPSHRIAEQPKISGSHPSHEKAKAPDKRKSQFEKDEGDVLWDNETRTSPKQFDFRHLNGMHEGATEHQFHKPCDEMDTDAAVRLADSKPSTSEVAGGWLSVGTSQPVVKPEPQEETSCNGRPEDTEADNARVSHTEEEEDKKEVKPLVTETEELLRDSQGQPLKNVCEVKVVNLLARPIGSHREKAQHTLANSNFKNFKKFKKTQHAGSGELPTIIGGRDLEVYTGDRHRDIEHLFATELEENNRREEEERKSRQLFEWDSGKAKKAGSRKVR